MLQGPHASASMRGAHVAATATPESDQMPIGARLLTKYNGLFMPLLFAWMNTGEELAD